MRMFILNASNSPFSSPSKSGDFDPTSWIPQIEGWTEYIVWSFIFIFVAGFLYFSGRTIFGMVAKNGEIQKNSIAGAMTCLILLLGLRLGLPLTFAIVNYGFNVFLYDLIHLISGSLLYISTGVLTLGVCFYFLYALIKHPGVRRRGIHFFVAGIVLIVISYIVPVVFLQV
ncbi:hypothetical protein ACTWQB_16725 [Piscibacillus sp. B03]|uniref:hypothetical protein n=1 Tax=Piscibacillus sp. B03 TaxID=3457430 RepID=UPI003FCC56A0